jgi:hypothetical protein
VGSCENLRQKQKYEQLWENSQRKGRKEYLEENMKQNVKISTRREVCKGGLRVCFGKYMARTLGYFSAKTETV